MSDVIAGLRRDMQQRLKDIEKELADVQGLLAEQEEIKAALARPPFAESARPVAKPSPVRAKNVSRSRAPRGANREAILSIVGDRPGATAAEISDVTKIPRAVTYNTLAKLIEQGRIEKTELPGGQTGYKTAAEQPAAAA